MPGGRTIAGALLLILVAGAATASATSLSLSSQLFTPYRTCTLTATPSTTTVVADASVRQASATSNFGTVTTNDVASSASANRRLYIRFDLTGCSPAIPSGAVVRLATLRLYVSALPAVCRMVDIFRVTAAWTENGITWNNQPFGTAINNPSSASATDTFGAGTPVGCENRTTGTYMTGANPTADVAAWVAGATNNGWMLRDDVEGSATARTETVSAKQLSQILQAPQLVITYVEVP
jgi:hypothetical protein